MAESANLPGVRAALVNSDGTTTREFYTFFRGLSLAAGLTARVDDLTVRVEALENGSGRSGNVLGKMSIVSQGVLSNGIVTVQLDGDVDIAPALSFYGALTAGSKGWKPYSANFQKTTLSSVDYLDLVDLADSGVGAALVRITRDSKGRISGTHAATTTDLAEGANLYYTPLRIQQGAPVFAIAAGTANAITAAFTPAIATLTDGMQLRVRALLANTTTTPTLQVDATTAHTITKNGGVSLAVGDINGVNHELLVRYNLANARWELLNPASSGGGGGVPSVNGISGAVTIASGSNVTVSTAGSTITIASSGGGSGDSFAVASGADTITATFSPAPTLADGLQFKVRAAAANATTSPTFNPNSLGALTIYKLGGIALVAGDIHGAGHELIIRYRASPARYELINPAALPSGGTTGQALLKASAADGDAYWATLALAASYTSLSQTDKSANTQVLYSGRIAVGKISGSGFSRSVKPITGKKYFEALYSKVTGSGATIAAGVATSAASVTSALGYSTADGWAMWGGSVGARSNGVTAVSATVISGDTVGFFVDQTSGKIWIALNGVQLQGDPATNTSPIWSGITGTLYAAACPWDLTAQLQMRWSPDDWYYTPPSGYGPITS